MLTRVMPSDLDTLTGEVELFVGEEARVEHGIGQTPAAGLSEEAAQCDG